MVAKGYSRLWTCSATRLRSPFAKPLIIVGTGTGR